MQGVKSALGFVVTALFVMLMMPVYMLAWILGRRQ